MDDPTQLLFVFFIMALPQPIYQGQCQAGQDKQPGAASRPIQLIIEVAFGAGGSRRGVTYARVHLRPLAGPNGTRARVLRKSHKIQSSEIRLPGTRVQDIILGDLIFQVLVGKKEISKEVCLCLQSAGFFWSLWA